MVRFLTLLLLALSLNANAKSILVLGDSLSAGYGIDVQRGWVQLLDNTLNRSGRYHIINASISGETTGGALTRLPSLLKMHKPAIIIVELGGNDGLRGHPIKLIKKNLTAIMSISQAAGAKTLLLGMQIPPNYGQRYTHKFADVYTNLAQEMGIPLVPFFLENVALQPELMQDDGIHPTAGAQKQLLDNVMPHLTPLLQSHQKKNTREKSIRNNDISEKAALNRGSDR